MAMPNSRQNATKMKEETKKNHLTFDEIVECVSLSKLNEEAFLLASKVDTHIRECDECLELVRAVRKIYEEFVKMGKDKSFSATINASAMADEKTKIKLDEIRAIFKSLEK